MFSAVKLLYDFKPDHMLSFFHRREHEGQSLRREK